MVEMRNYLCLPHMSPRVRYSLYRIFSSCLKVCVYSNGQSKYSITRLHEMDENFMLHVELWVRNRPSSFLYCRNVSLKHGTFYVHLWNYVYVLINPGTYFFVKEWFGICHAEKIQLYSIQFLLEILFFL